MSDPTPPIVLMEDYDLEMVWPHIGNYFLTASRPGLRSTRVRLRTEASIMSHDDLEFSGSDLISVNDAYLAMYRFVDAYWERGGRGDGSVTLLRHALGPSADPHDQTAIQTSDPASWGDWLAAVKAAKAEGFPGNL